MVLPAHILLPPPREVARPGQSGPAKLPAGTIVIGRVLGDAGGAPATTPDGSAALRTQFPQGIVLIPTEDRLPAGTQLFAQVREEQGRTLLGLLDGADRGTLFRGAAVQAAAAGGQTSISLGEATTPVETAAPVRVGQPVVAQLQPRGSRAVLRALPPSLNQQTPATGVVQSVDGPLLTVTVENVELLAVARGDVAVGDTVQVRIEATPTGLQVVARPQTAAAPSAPAAPPAPAAGAPTPLATAALPVQAGDADALLQTLGVTVTPVTRVAATALVELVARARTAAATAPGTPPAAVAPPTPAAQQTQASPAAVQGPDPAAGPPAPAEAPAPSAGVALAPGAVDGQAAVLPAPGGADAPPPLAALTRLDVDTAVALQALGEPVDAANLAVGRALVRAEVAVTPQTLQAARELLEFGAPITPRTISAALALADIMLPPEPQTVEALSRALFSPSTLSADLTAVRETLVQLIPDLPGAVQPAFAEIARGLTALLVDLSAGAAGAQVADATQFGGLHTEQLLGALIEIVDRVPPPSGGPPNLAAADAPAATPGRSTVPRPDAAPVPTERAVVQAANHAARDVRVLLGRLQTALTDLGPNAPVPAEARAAIEAGAGRIIDRLQGLQLQNLRAPVAQHLTLELPIVDEGKVQHVQVRVYYRVDDETGGQAKQTIDERNTTIALRLAMTQLGRVNATVAIADGQLTTDFRVGTPEVADHLLDGTPELRAGLQELGYEVGRIAVTARRLPSDTEEPAAVSERLGPDGIDVRV